jgi:small conductance mechanosensitive channel
MTPAVVKNAEAFGTFLLDKGGLLLAVVIGFLLLHQLVRLLIRRLSQIVVRQAGVDHPEVKRRAATIAQVLKSVSNVLLIALCLFFSLEILGVDVRPLIAGAGILGVAVGFGAQSLVRDCLSGMFILAEHQIAVGDTVTVAGVTGVVETVKVRSITLRDPEGRVHYIPNGEIRVVTNLSQGVARVFVDVPVPATADPALALATLFECARAFATEPANRGRLIDAPEVLGFERIGAGQNTIRLAVRSLRHDAGIARELRFAALRALAAHGIIAGSTDADVPHETPSTGETAS